MLMENYILLRVCQIFCLGVTQTDFHVGFHPLVMMKTQINILYKKYVIGERIGFSCLTELWGIISTN